jgi:hypothetical protein
MSDRRVTRSCLAAVALFASCARPPAAAPPPTTRQETPLTVTWVESERTGTSATLIARVNRRAAVSVPVKVTVEAPKGVTVAGGAMTFFIPASEGPSVTDTPYVVTFAAPPAEDLLLIAEAAGTGFGVHAEDRYRFGRAAPVVAAPEANGTHLQVGGQDLGASVPLKQ